MLIFNVLKKQSFFDTGSGKVSSTTTAVNSSNNTHNQNEAIKDQLRNLASRPKTPYIAGCMQTQKGCQCFDAKGKVVKVKANICQKNVRDSTSNQHKAFDATAAH